jgi:hypothetical protein
MTSIKSRFSLLLLALVLAAFATPGVFGANPKGGALGAGGGQGHRSGDILMCDQFTITCNDGSTDTCCADVQNCLNYCAQVCGGPCVYVDNAD